MKNNIIVESGFTHPETEVKITVYVAKDVRVAHNSRRRRYGLEKEIEDFRAIAVWDDVTQMGIFFSASDLTHATVAHEIDHIAKYIHEYMGARPRVCKRFVKSLEDPLAEPEAYLTGWITGKVYKIFKKHGLQVK